MELGARLPLIVRYKLASKGVSFSDVISTVDYAPTILAFAGVASLRNYDTDGVSWAALMLGTGPLPSRAAVGVEIAYDRAVVGARYKLVAAAQGAEANTLATAGVRGLYPAWGAAEQLYDLAGDGAEQRDISAQASGNASLQAELDALKAALARHTAATVDKAVGVASPSLGSCSVTTGPTAAPTSTAVATKAPTAASKTNEPTAVPTTPGFIAGGTDTSSALALSTAAPAAWLLALGAALLCASSSLEYR